MTIITTPPPSLKPKTMDFASEDASPEDKLKVGKALGNVVKTAVKVRPIGSGVVPALAPINQVVQAGVQIAGALKK